ncbi:MAG: hypothetical protein ACLQNE_45805, partial [Thermoguttaceae bacterium]
FNWWPIPAAISALMINVGERQLIPPLAVFLSTSTIKQISLCVELQRRLYPFRLINMLNLEAVRVARKKHGIICGLAELDGNRLIQSDGWEHVISYIVSCVPLIIFDLRENSENLQTECAIINKEGLHWKVVAVHDGSVNIDELEHHIFSSGSRKSKEVAWLQADQLLQVQLLGADVL